MEHFLINSSVCLFSLWLVYKLLLENVSWHYFKRFYLLGSLVISAVIPFLVVRTVTIPLPQTTPLVFPELEVMETTTATTGFEFDWSSVLLLVYVIGVLIMAFRFIKNLYALRIKSTDEIRGYEAYTLVLRKLIEVPHSFLTRIYASITDFKSGAIPDSVLQHEKAHLDQKHSLDILAIEVLLILMWFNPLLYLIKYSIKLNHEFLADQAVLANGVDTKTYQETLLAYSSSSQNRALANTFNFPIIKKRFTLMKTRTSNTSLVFRSLALIPVIALLVISCGKEETEFIEIEEIIIIEDDSNDTNQKLIVVDPNDPDLSITINGKPHFYQIKGDQIDIFNEAGELQDFESQGYEVRIAEIVEIIEVIAEISTEDIKEYNQLAILHQQKMKLDNQLIVLKDKTLRMQLLYYSMNEVQQANNEPWPYLGKGNDVKAGQIPPPPPPTAVISLNNGFIKVDGIIRRYDRKDANNTYYDHDGKIIDTKGKKLEHVDSHDLPPPPPPASPLDYIENAGDHINYYIDDEKVTAEKAKSFLKKNGNKGVQIMPVNGVNSLKMYTRVGVLRGT